MPVRYVVRDGIGWVVLDRPPVNALNSGMLQGIINTMGHLAEDDDVWLSPSRGRARFSQVVQIYARW